MVVSTLIIKISGQSFDLKLPGLNALGSIAIILGLLCTLRDGKQQHALDAEGSDDAIAKGAAGQGSADEARDESVTSATSSALPPPAARPAPPHESL